MGKERWGQDGTWLQFYAQRAAEVMAVFSAEMGDPARVVRVISTQTGVKGVEEQILMAPLVVAEGQPPPVESFDAYAVTGYFSGLLGAEHKLPWVQRWVAESDTEGDDQGGGGGADRARGRGLPGRASLRSGGGSRGGRTAQWRCRPAPAKIRCSSS